VLGDLGGDGRVDGTMDGDQVAGADELVQLDIVDVAALAQLGAVQHHEDVVTVGAHLGYGVTFDAGRMARGWKLNTSDRTRAAASSQTGMSTPTSPSSRAQQHRQSSTGCRSIPSSDTKRTSIPLPPPGSSDSWAGLRGCDRAGSATLAQHPENGGGTR
jgi:hypothetical protein